MELVATRLTAETLKQQLSAEVDVSDSSPWIVVCSAHAEPCRGWGGKKASTGGITSDLLALQRVGAVMHWQGSC